MTGYPAQRPDKGEVLGLLDDLEAHLNALTQETPHEQQSERRLHRRTRLSLWLFGGAALAVLGSVLDPQHNVIWLGAYAVLLVLASVTSGFAIARATAEQADTWRALRRPRQAMLASLKASHDLEDALITKLLGYQPTTLHYTRARLAERAETQRERADGIFGGISKIGLFPSVLAALVAAASAIKGAPLWAVLASGVGTGLLILNQDTAAGMHMATVDTKLMLGLLDRAIAIKDGEQSGVPSPAAVADPAPASAVKVQVKRG